MKMSVRTVLFAGVAALAAATAPAFAQNGVGRCDETSFRVYFQQGSASLDQATQEVLDAAARNVEGCDYSEIRITVDARNNLSAQRGRAIAAALDEDAFDATHIVARSGAQRVSYGPDYAQVTLSPTRTQPEQLNQDREAGV